MQCREILAAIQARYPLSCALEWDNVGLLAGDGEKEVQKIYLAVDATDEVIAAAGNSGADLLITHHPLLFSGIKRITEEDFIGRRVLRLIRQDMAYYAMHTNYDVMGMGELAARKLGLTEAEVLEVTCPVSPLDGTPQGIGRVADLGESVTLAEYCQQVKDAFGLEKVRLFGDPAQKISRAAISPGSGKSMVGAALQQQADVLVTGDIDHHTGLDAVAQGLAIIDGGHYGIEKIFVPDMAEFLRQKFPRVEVLEAPVSELHYFI